MASISCQHIYKIYPGATAPAVTDFNLEIQDKEFIIFVGPSGNTGRKTGRLLDKGSAKSLHVKNRRNMMRALFHNQRLHIFYPLRRAL